MILLIATRGPTKRKTATAHAGLHDCHKIELHTVDEIQ